MSATALPPELRATAPALALRFAELVAGLIAVIARVFYRHPTRFQVILPLCLWLERTRNRLAKVMHKLESGTLRARKPQVGGKSSGKSPVAFPRRRDWLLVDLKHEGAYYAQRLEALLTEPDIAQLVATTPQAQRLLRPLCHMLGVRHASLGIKPEALNKPPSPASGGVGCKADQGRGPSRSDGKGEGRAASRTPATTPPSPLPGFRAWAVKSRPRQGEGAATGTPSDPYATLCPRLRTRWPFNTLPQFRQA